MSERKIARLEIQSPKVLLVLPVKALTEFHSAPKTVPHESVA